MKLTLTGAIVAASALIAGVAGAQTFEQTVNDAVKKDGFVVSEVQAQKQVSTQDPELIEAQRGGGQHGGHEQPGRGGHEQPGRGGHEQPGRGHEGHGGGHEGHGGGHGNRHDGLDHHGRYGWGWDAWGRRQWLGWVIWNPAFGRCSLYYSGLRSNCYADCRAELNAGVDNPGDYQLCMQSCEYQYDTVWGPYWRAPSCF
jgi:hypothetical protein